jgi:hypothetical protein
VMEMEVWPVDRPVPNAKNVRNISNEAV